MKYSKRDRMKTVLKVFVYLLRDRGYNVRVIRPDYFCKVYNHIIGDTIGVRTFHRYCRLLDKYGLVWKCRRHKMNEGLGRVTDPNAYVLLTRGYKMAEDEGWI